ncbi:helicase HerA domain-containing protein [Thermocrinis sp.]
MNNIFQKLLEEVSQAESSLRVASAWIRGEILEDLLKALKSHVKLEVILRAGERKDLEITDYRTFKAIRDFGGEVYINPRLHAKFLVIDDKKAYVGSANLTYSGVMEGNLEATVEIEDEERIKELLNLWERVKRESLRLEKKAVAVAIKAYSSTEIDVLLLEDLPEQSFLKVNTERGFLVCKLGNITTWDLDLLRQSLKTVQKDWTIAMINAMVEEGGRVKVGKVHVVCEYIKLREKRKESFFGVPLRVLDAGTQFLRMEEEEELFPLMSTNMSGYPMDVKVVAGNLFGTETPAYLDITKIASMHMAVLGSTGSGKTTFVANLLEKIKDLDYAQTFVIDLFGEYGRRLNQDSMHYAKFPYTLFPVSAEDVKDLFKRYGFEMGERSSEEKAFFGKIRRLLKPDLKKIAYSEKSLEDILLDAPRDIKEHSEELLELLSRDFGEGSVRNQREVWQKAIDVVDSKKPLVICDLSDLVDPESRLNIVGLIMKEIFLSSMKDGHRRILVLEEAHNFAPERGAVDVSAGRENIALQMTKRIALEGRKFGVGLVAITQRPANLNKYILSQMNTQAIFRLVTKNDLEAVSLFFGEKDWQLLNLLPLLRPGTLYLNGLAVPFGMLIEIEL